MSYAKAAKAVTTIMQIDELRKQRTELEQRLMLSLKVEDANQVYDRLCALNTQIADALYFIYT